MLSFVRLLCAGLLITAVLPFVPDPAHADVKCQYRDPIFGYCEVGPEKRPKPQENDRTEPTGNEDDGGKSKQRCEDDDGSEQACDDVVLGRWSNDSDCYFRPVDPQPSPGSRLWQGHYPDGAVYAAFCPPGSDQPAGCEPTGSYGQYSICFVWFPGAPTVQISAAELAQQAVDQMGLRGPLIRIAPEPGGVGLVGMPVWLSTSVSERTWGPNTASASVPGLSVSATAKAAFIDWTMGDGRTRHCVSPGTPYRDAFGDRSSPDCGHRYSRTGMYQVTGVTHWVIRWTASNGETGVIEMDLRDSVRVRVGEAQSIMR